MSIFKDTLNQMKHQQQFLAILVFAFIAIIIWTSASLISSQNTVALDKDLLKLSRPLTPTINQKVIQELQQKKVFLNSQLRDFPIYIIRKEKGQVEQVIELGSEPEPSPSPSPKTRAATSSATPVSTATNSAQLSQ